MKENIYKKITEEEREKVKEELRALLKKANNTIYQALAFASPSGMSRHVKNFISYVDENGKSSVMSIDWYICRILSDVMSSEHGVFTKGSCNIAYNLGIALNGNGYSIQNFWV